MSWLLAYIAVGWLIRAGMVLTILRRNFAPGASIAWLLVIFLHPYIGLLLYQMFGENRLGPGRVDLHHALLKEYATTVPSLEPAPQINPGAAALTRLAKNVGCMPALAGNHVDFITGTDAIVQKLAADIDAATSHVHLLYYIFMPDATGRQIAEALKRAVARGVQCRVIVDEFASRHIFRSGGFAAELKASGIKIVGALPTSPFRRRDLRNHRKIAVIDNRIAYCGSHNLTNPDYGGRRGAPWIDISGRFTGPIVCEFARVFLMDWAFETPDRLPAPGPEACPAQDGGIPMQIVPSGPISPGESFRRLLMGIIESTQHQLFLTTPYFVPDEPTLLALLTAKDRGVNVTIVLPHTSDNIFTAAAGRAQYAKLLNAGISIYLYQRGLIHAKTITADDQFAIIGSANIDVRSFHLNFEISTILYDSKTTCQLKALQQAYLSDATRLDSVQWKNRSVLSGYVDASMSLISPLL